MLFPGKVQLIAILIGAAVAVGVPAWASWQIGAERARAQAEEAYDTKVNGLRQEYVGLLREQVALSDKWRATSEEGLQKLTDRVAGIKIEHRTINNNITKEVESNPGFYLLQVPEGGRLQWETARRGLQ